LLDSWGIPVAKERLVQSEDEAAAVCQSLGYPVALKVASPYIAHKSEIGGVLLNICNEDALRAAYRRLWQNVCQNGGITRIDGVIVAKMAEAGCELSLGMKTDPVFGPIVMVGAGGIYMEVLKDFRLLIPPVDAKRAKEAVDSLAIAPLLYGARGQAKRDVAAFVETVVRFSHAVAAWGDRLFEIDINPVIVHEEGKGVTAVDALVRTKAKGEGFV
jgi:succinyl-CoA synthetase beta subunit